MVSIREYKYKIINDKLYLGIELEAKGQTFFKNSVIGVEFISGDTTVKYDNSFVIPYIAGEGIICLGHEYTCDVLFDRIEVTYYVGSIEWETNYLDNVQWSFESYDQTNRKLTYKVINKGRDNLAQASLNLVFFNKGEMICGSSIEKSNLLTEREYYFEYDVPVGIEFTEVHPYLVLPSTNHLLYKGFIISYLSKKDDISKLSVTIPHKEIEEFKDKSLEYDNQLSEENKNLKRIKKLKKRSFPYVLSMNVLKVIKNIFKSFFTSIAWVADFIWDHSFTYFLACAHVIFTILIIIAEVCMWKDMWNDPEIAHYELFLLPTLIALGPYVIPAIFCYIPAFMKNAIEETDYLNMKDFISEEDKEKQISESLGKINDLTLKRDEFITNMDKHKEEYENYRQQIIQENLDIDKQNEENKQKVQDLEKSINDMIENHPEYKVMQSYDEIDFDIVDDALANGGLTINEIENYRLKVKEELERYKKEEEERLRQLQEAEKAEAFRQEMRNMMSHMDSEHQRLRYETEALAAAANQQLSYARQQSYAMTDAFNRLNRSAERIADNGDMANIYAQGIYNRFI